MSYIYVAYSKNGNLTKIGKAKNVSRRMKELRRVKYASQTDWSAQHSLFIGTEVSHVENQIHARLAEHKIHGIAYSVGSKVIGCNELFSMVPSEAINIVESFSENTKDNVLIQSNTKQHLTRSKKRRGGTPLRRRVLRRINKILGLPNCERFTIRALLSIATYICITLYFIF